MFNWLINWFDLAIKTINTTILLKNITIFLQNWRYVIFQKQQVHIEISRASTCRLTENAVSAAFWAQWICQKNCTQSTNYNPTTNAYTVISKLLGGCDTVCVAYYCNIYVCVGEFGSVIWLFIWVITASPLCYYKKDQLNCSNWLLSR